MASVTGNAAAAISRDPAAKGSNPVLPRTENSQGPIANPADSTVPYIPRTRPLRSEGAESLIQNSERMKIIVIAPWNTKRSGNHIQTAVAAWKPIRETAAAAIEISNVGTTPNLTASDVATGARAMEATPAVAEFNPINVAE